MWIYDRHCSLLFHSDWSVFHNRNIPANGGGTSSSTSSTLSLSEQSKLVYGVVFSLRNMTRKLSPLDTTTTTSSSKESFQSFSTSTYTLSHFQTITNYTFILITDPVTSPTRRAPIPTSNNNSSGSFSGGGGIPATGGMSTTGVLSQIARGPWIEFVARNAACTALERIDDDDDDEEEEEKEKEVDAERRAELQAEKRKKRVKELEKQRMTGIGKSIDSEAFKAAVERGESTFAL